MNYRLLFFLILFLCNRSTAQEEVPDGVVIMINPVRWGTIVYVKSEELTKRKLLNEFKVLNREVFDGCHLENGNYESWYCNKEPAMVFQGLDGYGNKSKEVMLCEENNFFSKYKYFNKEMFIKYNCIVAYLDIESDLYEFYTILEWFGDDA